VDLVKGNLRGGHWGAIFGYEDRLADMRPFGLLGTYVQLIDLLNDHVPD